MTTFIDRKFEELNNHVNDYLKSCYDSLDGELDLNEEMDIDEFRVRFTENYEDYGTFTDKVHYEVTNVAFFCEIINRIQSGFEMNYSLGEPSMDFKQLSHDYVLNQYVYYYVNMELSYDEILQICGVEKVAK